MALVSGLCRLSRALRWAGEGTAAEAALMDALHVLEGGGCGRWEHAAVLAAAGVALAARGRSEEAEGCFRRAQAFTAHPVEMNGGSGAGGREKCGGDNGSGDRDQHARRPFSAEGWSFAAAAAAASLTPALQEAGGDSGSRSGGDSGSRSGGECDLRQLVADVCAAYGTLLRRRGDPEAALALHKRALRADERRLGPAHPYCAAERVNCGDLCAELPGRGREAQEHYRRATDILAAAAGAGRMHAQLARALNNRGLLLCALGMAEAAEGVYRRCLVTKEGMYGAGHPTVAVTLNNLACCMLQLGKLAWAEPLLLRALEIRRGAL
ncbi:unnamed protein product, partial [Phaeothamnion confervicola]